MECTEWCVFTVEVPVFALCLPSGQRQIFTTAKDSLLYRIGDLHLTRKLLGIMILIRQKVAGLPVDNVRIFAFALVGLFTGLAGVLLTSMLSSANVIMATGFELRVIAVVVVGGTSLQGGQGTLLGSITGALFFSVISNALNMFGVAAYWQYVAVGLILVTALGIEALRSRFMEVARV